MDSDLALVTHKLPVIFKRGEKDGLLKSLSATGGLTTCLREFAGKQKLQWFGCPGGNVSLTEWRTSQSEHEEGPELMPVVINERVAELFYNGFANSVLWPLFHDQTHLVAGSKGGWKAYQIVTRLFAAEITAKRKNSKVVWIHDYHLMLLPSVLRSELREVRSEARIGFFLHVPFPAAKSFGAMSEHICRTILRGMLGADLIGFHTARDVQNFRETCWRFFGLRSGPGSIKAFGKSVAFRAFAVGADPQRIINLKSTPPVQQQIDRLRYKYTGLKLLIGVDRVDVCKGIPHKLRAFEMFLIHHPQWIGRVKLIQLAVPSREGLESVQRLYAVIMNLVQRINICFGSSDYMPIDLVYSTLETHELVALYACADVCIVSSIRDGLNLVSFEYVVAQQTNHGVLLLSRFTGAAQCLKGALLIDPCNCSEFAAAIRHAITMSRQARAEAHASMYRYVTRFTSTLWGDSFLSALRAISVPTQGQRIVMNDNHAEICLASSGRR